MSAEFVGYINAGGRGSRLSPVVAATDGRVRKALLRLGRHDRTLVEHQIAWFAHRGASRIVVAAGSAPDVAAEARELSRRHALPPVGTTLFDEELGTAGDLCRYWSAANANERSLVHVVVNSDTVIDVDLCAVLEAHRRSGRGATMVVSRRSDAPQHGAIAVDDDGTVVADDEGGIDLPLRSARYRASSTGCVVFDPNALDAVLREWRGDAADVYRWAVPLLVQRGCVGAFDNGERYFQDVGTPASWQRANEAGAEIDRHLEHL